MQEAKAPDFFEYIDENGKMRADAPESAKKAFKAWKRENPMKVSVEELDWASYEEAKKKAKKK